MRTDARTVESLPPDAPIAIRSPGEKREVEVIVWWISASKTSMKHALQSFWWFFGRIIRAREALQMAQGTGAISKDFKAQKDAFLVISSRRRSHSKYFEIAQLSNSHVFELGLKES